METTPTLKDHVRLGVIRRAEAKQREEDSSRSYYENLCQESRARFEAVLTEAFTPEQRDLIGYIVHTHGYGEQHSHEIVWALFDYEDELIKIEVRHDSRISASGITTLYYTHISNGACEQADDMRRGAPLDNAWEALLVFLYDVTA